MHTLIRVVKFKAKVQTNLCMKNLQNYLKETKIWGLEFIP